MVEKRQDHVPPKAVSIEELLDILFGNPQNIPGEAAQDTDITEAESSLGIKLPPSFIKFLRRSNGLVAYQTEHFFGTTGDENLVDMKARMVYVPSEMYPFFHGEGDAFCFFDTSSELAGEYPIFGQRVRETEIKRSHNNFTFWLQDFIKEFESGL